MDRQRERQSGFGLLETMTGLIVFVVLALLGTKAYHGVVATQKESSQVKALTDAVSTVSEQLSSLTVDALSGTGSKYLVWSQPAPVGNGEYLFRYRTVAKPLVNGVSDSSVAGLEVEISPAGQAGFQALRKFATLIAARANSKDRLGQVSTQAERDAEAAFYAGLKASARMTDQAAVTQNQIRLNSYSCYDKSQCCGFMKMFFANPAIKPQDGVQEKCYYRCALAGNVPISEWNSACNTDFCAISPLKTKDQCCAAIAAGDCPPGSVCANLCIACLGVDGSTCKPPECKADPLFDDFFDCKNGTLCGTGAPIPAGDIPGFGNVQDTCKLPDCATQTSDCSWLQRDCCLDYWGKIALGDTPDDRHQICRQLITQEQCCIFNLQVHDWNLYCSQGKIISAQYMPSGKWYCGWGPGWDQACAFTQGCSTSYVPQGAPAGGSATCGTWPYPMNSPWSAPFPPPPPSPTTTTSQPPPPPVAADQPPSLTDILKEILQGRIPSMRGGQKRGSKGGHE